MGTRAEKLDYAVEVMLDFLAHVADGRDDDELVFWQAELNALADACGVEDVPEVEPQTAGEIRAATRRAKARLAAGDGPATKGDTNATE